MGKLYLGLCGLMLWGSTAYAQQDVTSAYLTNPSFEADASACTLTSDKKVSEGNEGLRGWNITPQGWEATSPGKALLISKDCSTDNSFGKTAIADGDYAYYQRFGWGSANSELRQTTTNALPKGEYELKFKTKAFCANSASTTATVTVSNDASTILGTLSFACSSGSAGIMATSEWIDNKVSFVLNEDSKITIAAVMGWGNGGSCIVYDDFTLTQLPEGSIDPDKPSIEGGTEKEITSPTEGTVSHDFVDEETMKQDLLQMLVNSMVYAKNIWYNCAAPNSKSETCGYFKANSAGNSNEDGVRTNADFSMICAFLYKYAQGKVTLPTGIAWDDVKEMALKSLVFGYSTHKANKFKVTSNSAYWGSLSNADHTWESSLWAMSLAYSSFFLADELSETQKTYIYNMIKAECNYELERTIPTGYSGDTKAEENGWETNILACALGLYPNDALATKWFERLRAFAINCYSHVDDANNATVIDPDYDDKTVKDLFVGKNLYDDYTLQNHNYFHTSYQNVVMQELGESQLALQLFQGENAKWKTNALMHNNQKVMDEVLCKLALADGELAMPNGNDWSMFLYDQITSYTTAACYLRDANALMLENMAYKNIKARQTTTDDGSWLLNSDIGPRRMGVEAHRVMMTYLMHVQASTANMQAASWAEFSKSHESAYVFVPQNIVRANTDDRFSVFSWSNGLKSYTGYIASNTPDKNKIIVPYKKNNTGNIIGWYNVSGKTTDATPSVSGIYGLNGNSYTMNGKLLTNGSSLENNFTIYSTPGNAFVYMDYVVGKASGTITAERGGLMAISTDPFTKEKRTLYYGKGRLQADGTQTKELNGNWVNIDNEVGIVTTATDKAIAFGDRELSSSINIAKIYPSYSNDSRTFKDGDIVDRRHIIYYNNVDSASTAALAAQAISLADKVSQGWNGVVLSDPDSARYLLLSNYMGTTACKLENVAMAEGAPVFNVMTAISENGATATFRCDVNHSVANTLRVFVANAQLNACQMKNDSCGAYLYNTSGKKQTARVTIWANGEKICRDLTLADGDSVAVKAIDGEIYVETIDNGDGGDDAYYDVTDRFLKNPSFELDNTYGTTSKVTLNGVTYDPCYTNSVSAADSKWPQVLPIEGWTAANSLKAGSKYAIMYSMPYSSTMYCISPSSVGNSASIMAEPAIDEQCGERCLTVMNSWDSGDNSIKQTISLPQGEYKLAFIAQYACANEMRHTNDYTISTTSENVNYSRCGISFGDNTIYRYPSMANQWEEVACPFTLSQPTEVTVSMGLETTSSVGAASQTRLYIDHVRLLSKEDITNGIAGVSSQPNGVDVYTIQGLKVRSHVPASRATDGLQKGVYIVGTKKAIKR